jgi:hypothetical protein
VSEETVLGEKLRKIEALFAGAGTVGERTAAEAALGRVHARLAELQGRDKAVEMQFSRKRCFADLVGVRRYDADFDRHDAGRIE